jgi:hypothetical protein
LPIVSRSVSRSVPTHQLTNPAAGEFEMGYSVNNPPTPILAALTSGPNSTTGGNKKIWLYASADPIATVQGAAYFSNGIQLGMTVGDLVFVIDTNLLRGYMNLVAAVTPVAAGTNAFQGAGLGSATLTSTTTPVCD